MSRFALVVIAACASPVVAPHPTLPTAREVLDRYVAALGGRDAILAHHAMTVHATLAVGPKIRLARTVRKEGAKGLVELVLPDGGTYRAGYDGTTGWVTSPGGNERVGGAELASQVRDADMYYPAHVLDYFSAMDVVDVSDFAGHTCYHLRGTTKWGKVNEQFYDTTTGLLVGYRFDSSWRGGAGSEREVFSGYRTFDRWQMPTRIEHVEPTRTLTETVEAITFDDLDDSVFDLPEAVKALPPARS